MRIRATHIVYAIAAIAALLLVLQLQRETFTTPPLNPPPQGFIPIPEDGTSPPPSEPLPPPSEPLPPPPPPGPPPPPPPGPPPGPPPPPPHYPHPPYGGGGGWYKPWSWSPAWWYDRAPIERVYVTTETPNQSMSMTPVLGLVFLGLAAILAMRI